MTIISYWPVIGEVVHETIAKLQGYFLYGLWIPGKGMGVLQNFQKVRARV